MGKATFKGLVPPDAPMLNEGVEFFRKVDAPQEKPRRSSVSFVPRISINWKGDVLYLDLDEDSWNLNQTSRGLT